MRMMKSWMLLSAVALSGCATQSFQVPVEDRNANPSVTQSVTNEGVVVNVVESNGLKTQAINETQPATITVQPSQTSEPVVTAMIASKPASKPPALQAHQPQPRNPAVLALLNTASQQKSQGRLKAAQASLERAQRIAPRDAEVYYQLADLRRRQKDFSQAEQMALRGLEVATQQPGMQRALWLLIAQTRESAGNANGAYQAKRKAAQY